MLKHFIIHRRDIFAYDGIKDKRKKEQYKKAIRTIDEVIKDAKRIEYIDDDSVACPNLDADVYILDDISQHKTKHFIRKEDKIIIYGSSLDICIGDVAKHAENMGAEYEISKEGSVSFD